MQHRQLLNSYSCQSHIECTNLQQRIYFREIWTSFWGNWIISIHINELKWAVKIPLSTPRTTISYSSQISYSSMHKSHCRMFVFHQLPVRNLVTSSSKSIGITTVLPTGRWCSAFREFTGFTPRKTDMEQ